jgi:hypothetical protein
LCERCTGRVENGSLNEKATNLAIDGFSFLAEWTGGKSELVSLSQQSKAQC